MSLSLPTVTSHQLQWFLAFLLHSFCPAWLNSTFSHLVVCSRVFPEKVSRICEQSRNTTQERLYSFAHLRHHHMLLLPSLYVSASVDAAHPVYQGSNSLGLKAFCEPWNTFKSGRPERRALLHGHEWPIAQWPRRDYYPDQRSSTEAEIVGVGYDLDNDSTVTVVGDEDTTRVQPLWETRQSGTLWESMMTSGTLRESRIGGRCIKPCSRCSLLTDLKTLRMMDVASS
ncbi:hypothetical protein BT96DRAFT_440958 [Gymnopus androsaceus JB14]|uniref:Uncharacterized protein n=1 Tax=Gymnopus androsaceus JB14 TaxID=1447944 RepID=A0A6A4HXU8_9AGAR|nr:hypothetical protein BT96DRAFT_440958 [Gymnopus androsaceus JB14]